MLKSVLVNSQGEVLEQFDGMLVTTTGPASVGTFKSATRAAAGTTTVTAPTTSGSIIVTDIVLSGEKQAASSTTVQFTDGSNTVPIFVAQQAEGTVNMGMSFLGRVQGWINARIDMVTVGTHDTTVCVTYTKVPTGIPFAEWDALR